MKSEKRKRRCVMLAHPLTEKRLESFPETVIAQPKLNGLRCRVVYGEKIQLLTSTGVRITSMPHIIDALFAQFQYHHHRKDTPIPSYDGELYNHDLSLQKVSGIVRRQYASKESKLIHLYLFDIIDTGTEQESRIFMLRTSFNYHGVIHLVPSIAIFKRYWQWCCGVYKDKGYEGIIIRHPKGLYEPKRSKYLLKYKPLRSDSYKIIGVFEAIDKYGDPKDIAGGLFLRGEEGNKFSCGMGIFGHEMRADIWRNKKEYAGKYAIIKYPSLTDRGIPSQPILTSIIGTQKEEVNDGN